MDELESYLKDLYSDLNYSVSKFDTQTLLISGGALGFSLTFIKDIVPFQEAIYIFLLYVALFCFILVIMMGFGAHYLSMKGITKRIDDITNENIGNINKDKLIPRLNLATAIILLTGILFMVAYCIINIESQRGV